MTKTENANRPPGLQRKVTVAGACLLLSIHQREKHPKVKITRRGILLGSGLTRTSISFDEVMLVYTTMASMGDDFEEVLAVEYSSQSGEGVIVIDRNQGMNIGQAIQSLKTALGDRWEDVYVGYKHLSRVRGQP